MGGGNPRLSGRGAVLRDLDHYAAFVAAEESETVIEVGLALARRMTVCGLTRYSCRYVMT